MISVKGYGLFAVMIVYVLSFFLVSKIMPAHTSNFIQTILIIVTIIGSTIINYIMAKQLNKKAVKHTVFDTRLERVVLLMSAFLLFMALMMLGGAIKDLNG